MGNFEQQKLVLTKDNELVYKERPSNILIFCEREIEAVKESDIKKFIEYTLDIKESEYIIKFVTNIFGYKSAIETKNLWIRCASIDSPVNLIMVTNMTQFLDSSVFNTWDEDRGKFLVYIVDKYGNFHWVHDMTNKELRQGHNLEAIYRNGGFDE